MLLILSLSSLAGGSETGSQTVLCELYDQFTMGSLGMASEKPWTGPSKLQRCSGEAAEAKPAIFGGTIKYLEMPARVSLSNCSSTDALSCMPFHSASDQSRTHELE